MVVIQHTQVVETGFEVQGNRVSLRPAWDTQDSVSKQNKTKVIFLLPNVVRTKGLNVPGSVLPLSSAPVSILIVEVITLFKTLNNTDMRFIESLSRYSCVAQW